MPDGLEREQEQNKPQRCKNEPAVPLGSSGTNHNEKAAGAGTHGGFGLDRGFGKTTKDFYHDGLPPTTHTLLDKWRLCCLAMRAPELGATAKNVFFLLLDAHYCNTGSCAPSIARIAVALGRGRDAIFEAMRSLEDNGWIRVRRARGSRSSYSFAWERVEPTASRAETSESGREIPTTSGASAPQTSREIPTATGRENPTHNQGDNKKNISYVVGTGPGVTSRGAQPLPAVRWKIELPSTTGEDFNQFWQAFPKKEGRSAALREWTLARAATVPASLLLTGARQYARKCSTREARWIASPANWLRGQRWLDDEPDRFSRTALAAPPPPDDEIVRAVRKAKAPRDEATWVFVQEGSPEWGRWRGAFAHARVALESGVGRLVQSENGALERRLGRYFPTPLPPSLSLLEAAPHG